MLILNGHDHWVFHSHNEFVRGKSHVNGIENFWNFAKRRLAKFNGCVSDKFVLRLKSASSGTTTARTTCSGSFPKFLRVDGLEPHIFDAKQFCVKVLRA